MVLAIRTQLPAPYNNVAAILDIDPSAHITTDRAGTSVNNPSTIGVAAASVQNDVARRVDHDSHTDCLDYRLSALDRSHNTRGAVRVNVSQNDARGRITAVAGYRHIPNHEGLRQIRSVNINSRGSV